MSVRILATRGTESQIQSVSSANQSEGQIAYATDTKQFYVSDGTQFNKISDLESNGDFYVDGQVAIGTTSPTANRDLTIKLSDDVNGGLEILRSNGIQKLHLSHSSISNAGSFQNIQFRADYGINFMQNQNRSSNNIFHFNTNSGRRITDTDAEQAFLKISPDIGQSGTANYVGLLMDVTETSVGSGTNSLMDLRVGGSSKFTIRNDGKLGVGTTSPLGIFHTYSTSAPVIESPSNAAMIIRRNDNVGYSSLLKYHSGNTEKFVAGLSDSGDFTGSTGEEYIIGTTKTNPLVVLKNDGKLGIGTTSPSQKLHVEGTSLFVGQGTWPMRMENDISSGNAEMGLWTVSNAYAATKFLSLVATPINNQPVWYFQGSGDGWQNITLQRYGGKVGIRTLEPSANLTVQGGGTTTGKTFLAQDSNASALFTILDSGDVGVGTTSPAAKLDVHGTISQTVDGATNQYPLSFYNSHAGTNFYLLRQRVVNTGNQVRTGLGVTGVPSCAFELGTKTDQILRFTTSGTISNVSTINGNNPLKINATEIRTGDTSGSIGANFNIVGDNNRVPLGIKQESGASQDRFITFRNSSNTEVLGIATTGGFTVTDSNLVKRFEFGHGYSPSPADGMGIGLDLKTENASGSIVSVGIIDVIQDDVSADLNSMRLRVGETTPTEIMRLESSGNVGIGTTSPHTTALLEVASTTKGVLFPRMTEEQKSAIEEPATGLIVYQTDGEEGLYIYKSTGWTQII